MCLFLITSPPPPPGGDEGPSVWMLTGPRAERSDQVKCSAEVKVSAQGGLLS